MPVWGESNGDVPLTSMTRRRCEAAPFGVFYLWLYSRATLAVHPTALSRALSSAVFTVSLFLKHTKCPVTWHNDHTDPLHRTRRRAQSVNKPGEDKQLGREASLLASGDGEQPSRHASPARCWTFYSGGWCKSNLFVRSGVQESHAGSLFHYQPGQSHRTVGSLFVQAKPLNLQFQSI